MKRHLLKRPHSYYTFVPADPGGGGAASRTELPLNFLKNINDGFVYFLMEYIHLNKSYNDI
jgi:hypothetical protein